MKALAVLHHMHSLSTVATYFTGAVKSDDVHFVMVSWDFLLQSVGAEKIVHTRLPTEIFAHACVEVKAISFLYVHPLPQQNMDSCHVLRQSKVFCFQAACHGALVRRSWG